MLGVGVALDVVVALTDVGVVVVDVGTKLLEVEVILLELDVVVLVGLSGVISSLLLKQVKVPWTWPSPPCDTGARCCKSSQYFVMLKVLETFKSPPILTTFGNVTLSSGSQYYRM